MAIVGSEGGGGRFYGEKFVWFINGGPKVALELAVFAFQTSKVLSGKTFVSLQIESDTTFGVGTTLGP